MSKTLKRTFNYYFCEYPECETQIYDQKLKFCRTHEQKQCEHNYEKSIEIEYDINSIEYKKYDEFKDFINYLNENDKLTERDIAPLVYVLTTENYLDYFYDLKNDFPEEYNEFLKGEN